MATVRKHPKIIQISLIVAAMCMISVSTPRADEPASLTLETCLNSITSRTEKFNLKLNNSLADKSVNRCADQLVELHNPSLLRKYLDKENKPVVCDSLDLPCKVIQGNLILINEGSKYSLNALTPSLYHKIATTILNESEVKIIEKHSDGIQGIIDRNFKRKEELKDSLPAFQFLKDLTIDLVSEYIQSVFKDFNFEQSYEQNFLNKEKAFYIDSLKKCLVFSFSLKQLYLCVSEFKKFAQPNIGLLTLQHFTGVELNKDIKTQEQKDSILSSAYNEFNICLIRFYYNDEYDSLIEFKLLGYKSINTLDRVSACAFSGILTGFHKAALYTLRTLSEDPTIDESVLNQSLSLCENSKLFIPKGIKNEEKYELLSSYSATGFEKIIKNCQIKISNNFFLPIAISQIETHPVISKSYKEKAHDFAVKTANKYVKVCSDLTGNKNFNISNCENYVFAGAVFDFFPLSIEEQIIEKSSTLDKESISAAVDLATKTVNGCKDRLFTNNKNLPNLSKQKLLDHVSTCLKEGVLTTADNLIEPLIKKELLENEILKKFDVRIGTNKLNKIKTSLNSCLEKNLKTDQKDLEIFIDHTVLALEHCELAATKTVATSSLDTVLKKQLIQFELTEIEAKKITDTYSNVKNNVYDEIDSAKSKENIYLIADTAERKIISHVGRDVISLIVKKESKGLIEESVETRAVNAAVSLLQTCIESNNAEYCSSYVKGKTVYQIVRETMALIVSRELKNATKNLIKSAQSYKIIDTYGAIDSSLKKKQNHYLIEIIYKKIQNNVSIKKIQTDKKIRKGIFNILNQSPNFFYKVSKEIIQPKLTAANVGIGKFLLPDEAFNYDYLMGTRQGKKDFVKAKVIKGSTKKSQDFINTGALDQTVHAQNAFAVFYNLIQKAILSPGFSDTSSGKKDIEIAEIKIKKYMKKAAFKTGTNISQANNSSNNRVTDR